MLVKMLTSLAGTDFTRAPGDLHECSEGEAARFIAAGFAEAVDGGAVDGGTAATGGAVLTEKAVAAKPKAERRGGRGRAAARKA